jgi:hypothetical protein
MNTIGCFASENFTVPVQSCWVTVSRTSRRAFGVDVDSERTYLKMISISQLQHSFLDFSMLGMIYQTLYLNKQD